MAKIISLINMKGGVGKTTLCIGIADHLASLGYRTLLIDIDPQFNATQGLLNLYKAPTTDDETLDNSSFYESDILPNQKTVFRLFKTQSTLQDTYTMPSKDEIITNLKLNLDIICGDLNLLLINKISNHTFAKRLDNFIKCRKLNKDYDYILIDCPPTLTIYTDSALIASDYYLIPNRVDRYSIIGIESLRKAISSLTIEENLSLKCLGVIYTMVDNKNPKKQTSIMQRFKNKCDDNEFYIFDSTSKIVNDIQRGVSGTVPTLYKSSKEDIEAITDEIITTIEREYSNKKTINNKNKRGDQ